jgi:hypothetical protein
MSKFDVIAQRYVAVWNELDADARRKAVSELWASDGRYVDPLGAAAGHAEIEATIGAAQAQFPGFEFSLAGPVDGHHDALRFSWALGKPGEEPLVIGFDVAELDGSGRLRTVLGFLDKVPS